MTLDLYYSNFTNVGDGLEKMYQSILLDDMKVATKPIVAENGVTVVAKAPENGKVQASMEKMSIRRKPDEVKRSASVPPPRLKLQIRKPEPIRYAPDSPQRYAPRSPQKISPPNRSTPLPQSPRKKTSPQELRSKKSPPTTNGSNEASPRSESATERSKIQSTNVDAESVVSDSSLQNGNDENILRQQNSRSSTPSSTAAPAKYKVNNSKVYFREENVENLTWNGETSFEGDPEDPDASTSPKVNPYSSSFLNFLSSN